MNQIFLSIDTHAAGAGTVDIYRRIHKALRACIGDSLLRVGRLNCDDRAEVAAVMAQVRAMAAFCASHLEHENRFVHAAIEARFPGASMPTAREHEHHASACRKLSALATAAEQARLAEREALAGQLYRDLVLFLADNLTHMQAEETENNTILWATHTDAELIAIEQAIVASLSPEERALAMRWMIPAINHHERLEVLGGMRRAAPPHVFEALLAGLKPLLAAPDWNKLVDAIRSGHALAA